MAEYREIEGFPGYLVGDDGSVWSARSLYRRHSSIETTWRQLKTPSNSDGYSRVVLQAGGEEKHLLVSRLVLLAFVGPCPLGLESCHNNGIPSDNHLENLRWDTHSNNEKDKRLHGTTNKGIKNGRAKLTEQQVRGVFVLRGNGSTTKEIASLYGVHINTIDNIIYGKRWKHLNKKESVPS